MRLFSYHLLRDNPPSDYYGIAKLCCALCKYTLQQFKVSGLHPPAIRGAHATLFTWPLPEFFHKGSQIQHFLGAELFEKYSALAVGRRRQTLNNR